MHTLPVSAIVPTRNRPEVFRETLASLEKQQLFPAELIVVDASDDAKTRDMLGELPERLGSLCSIRWMPADICGAAAQRNQGIPIATQPVIWFFDDDILFEPECVCRLWQSLQSEARLGGVNAMIVNQRYQPPGWVSRTLFQVLRGHAETTYAGLVIGPAVNLLPEDRDDLPEVVAVEWMNTTCTMYRREALPAPPFDSVFTGYSMMEDLTLSLRVGKKWQLANVRTARIFHDSQPGTHKADVRALAAMELANRHYVMTRVLEQTHTSAYLKLLLWEMFQLLVCATDRSTRSKLLQILKGKILGFREIRRRAQKV
ncbi:MAG TPA: glycosyltransferase [Blastocatellia bacterium]|nr:glycosyltransferase [Blastocatellia bacterium]